MFDACLAKDSKGDGTGCDNMTAVIVNFKEKIIEQPTNLKPEEIETVFVVNKIENEEEDEDDYGEGTDEPEVEPAKEQIIQLGLKRSASPDESRIHKKIKTEENGSKRCTTIENSNNKGNSEGQSISTTTTESDSSST